MLPLVSVVMCTWNGERFVEEQIRSILGQTYPSLELIIADDASTDNTADILKKFEGDARVTILRREKNLGLSKNFNLALQQARGSLVACSDQDDIWLPHKIETLAKHIGDALLIYSNSLLVDERGMSLDKTTADIRRMYTGSDSRGYVMHSVVWGHAMMIRSELLQRSLPIPDDIHHDDWIAFRALSLTGIKYHDEVLTHYRQHVSSTTRSIATHQPARTHSKRSVDARKKLYWYEQMRSHCSEQLKPFYDKLCILYAKKFTGRFAWELFFFLLAHRKKIFQFSRKGFISHVVLIFKYARGEKPF